MPNHFLVFRLLIKHYIDIRAEFPNDVGIALAKPGNKTFPENLQPEKNVTTLGGIAASL